MIKIIPRSLFGRIIAVLFVGLVIAQSLSTYVVLVDRGELLYQSIQGNLMSKTVGIVELLNRLDKKERDAITPLFSSNDLRLYLSDKEIKKKDFGVPQSSSAHLVEQQLLKILPQKTVVIVSLDGSLMGLMHKDGHNSKMMARMSSPEMMQAHSMAYSFHIQIQLSDGSWVIFERGVPSELFDWPIKLLSVLGILFGSVIVLSYVAVRSITEPLKHLRFAAEGLGADILQEPISEQGPIEVQQTAIAFNTMQRQLRRYIDDRSHILSAISHDLKTPLTRLRLRAELLENDEQRDKSLSDLDEMRMMIDSTLDFMRGISNNENTQVLDIMALLESIQADAQELGHELTLIGYINEPIKAKPLALKRCIENLLTNAIRYGERVTLKITLNNNELIISICDQGPGIPEADLEKIFEPFYRLDGSRAKHSGGHGLGLGIARNIARAHGGDIVIFNQVGGGLCADIRLPHLTKL